MRIVYRLDCFGKWRSYLSPLDPLPGFTKNECEWLVPGTVDQED